MSPWPPRPPKWSLRTPQWSIKVSHITFLGIESDPVQESSSHQLPAHRKGAGGRGEALRYIYIYIYIPVLARTGKLRNVASGKSANLGRAFVIHLTGAAPDSTRVANALPKLADIRPSNVSHFGTFFIDFEVLELF